ncbi:MAG TPA: FkbM family methyltransferase [Solirubrobacterales bacterium]
MYGQRETGIEPTSRAARDAVKHLLARVGIWFGRPNDLSVDYHVAALLRQHAADCVVDVGANVGQFATAIRRAGYRGPIISFEPVPEAFAELQDRSASDPDWTAQRVAAGDRPGALELNVSEASNISSFLEVKEEYVAGRPPARVRRTERVPIATIDDLLREAPYERIFLKTDTQGYDLKVLAGAGLTVDRTIGIQIELSVVAIYEGMPNYVEALAVLHELGFALTGMYRVPSFQVHEYDGVFLRHELISPEST